MWPFAALLLWPLAEIALFVTLGGSLGLWLTLLIILGTAVLGVMVIRLQGKAIRAEMRGAMRRGGMPLARGGMNILAGVLLILPGFLTDALGLLLLLPPVQTFLAILLARRIRARPPTHADVIEGEWAEAEPEPGPGRETRRSGWTRH